MDPFPASNMVVGAIFILCLATMLVGALIAVITVRIIRCVCGLAICSIGLAGLYYFLHSPFLALMEILIYVGAVCVTLVFAVMLAETGEPILDDDRRSTLLWGSIAVVVSAAIFWGLWRLGSHQDWSAPVARLNDGSVSAIGKSLLTTYSLAFELISLALLVAIVGALAIARTGRDAEPGQAVVQASPLPAGRPALRSRSGDVPGTAAETPAPLTAQLQAKS
jgi:NADH:ubiquinone oxidoreductase subunit 6 (subunit J)